MGLHEQIVEMGDRAVTAAHELNRLSTEAKDQALRSMAAALDAKRAQMLEANALDLKEGSEAGLSEAMTDRLRLTDARIDAMRDGILEVSQLHDPVGEEIERTVRPNGLQIIKRRVPIGVVAVIYESRPNVTADTAALCIKASNAVILRGGKEARRSNKAIADALREGGQAVNLPANALQLVETIDREAVRELVQLEGRVDLVIPRGGESLVRAVTEQARVPVIKHYKGVCHTYVDASADLGMALAIVENAKCQRPGVCNAMETLLVHEGVAEQFLPALARRLEARGVKIRGDEATRRWIPQAQPASEQDWYEEYLDLILAVRVVPSVEAAIVHINTYGSRHSDAIIANDPAACEAFTQRVDSAAVYVNASTRFTDGAEFGLGAEIGISTDKLHARGPMGLVGLTTYKYIILGHGQVRG